jgi:hypothetical protein
MFDLRLRNAFLFRSGGRGIRFAILFNYCPPLMFLSLSKIATDKNAY